MNNPFSAASPEDGGRALGSVNANVSHYRAAAEALADPDVHWLESLLTRRVPPAAAAFVAHPDDVKVVIDLEDGDGDEPVRNGPDA
ncbi:hypothetical protein [Nocardia sputi]|uniref:hypothetical protein n=1 Tax=Nocardia sputi TaxID=2943705 RepID=UPI0020BE8DFA|nr:hypothetical protein [Nocardia sputi]